MRKWQNFDLPNTSIIYTLLIGMAYTLTGTLALLFSPSGTKALMRQFVADAPKAHESLSTEARRVPVQGTPIQLISVFIAIFRLDTICRFWRVDWNRTADNSTLRKPLLSLGA